MKRSLRYDAETREMRLVMTDTWDGMHERYEFQLAGDDGKALRMSSLNAEGLDGMKVYGDGLGERYHVQLDPWGSRSIFLATLGTAVVEAKTPCPRWTNRRRKCETCKAEGLS